jgi:hypothetical protein
MIISLFMNPAPLGKHTGAFGVRAGDEPPGCQAGEVQHREDEKQKVHR